MKVFRNLPFLAFLLHDHVAADQPSIECQSKASRGADYGGRENMTDDGRGCLNWSDAGHPRVGDHNYCRNPGAAGQAVWCLTSSKPNTTKADGHGFCSVPKFHECPPLRVMDFSDDSDGAADSSGEFTHASIEKAALPKSFTLCSSFMVEAWTQPTGIRSSLLFLLRKDDGNPWMYVDLYAPDHTTEFTISVNQEKFEVSKFLPPLFPHTWVRSCVSMDVESTVRLVVDGHLLEERRLGEAAAERPHNTSIVLGWATEKNNPPVEYTGRRSNLNIFSSALSLEKMVMVTRAGREECEEPGDYLSWEKAEWTLHSKAKILELERFEGPCREESRVQVFPFKDWHWQHQCMDHCQKLGSGKSPPVGTLQEWQALVREVQAITPDNNTTLLPPWVWLSATEGDIEKTLGRPEHWSENVDVEESVWRDYYTGIELDNYIKPWWTLMNDTQNGETSNCLKYTPRVWPARSWIEFHCYTYDSGCPCQYQHTPILRLLATCPGSVLDKEYIPKQLPNNPEIIILGKDHSKLQYDDTLGLWVLNDARFQVSATTEATRESYVLGKHNWTIKGDGKACGKGELYNIQMKLTGCSEEEFTCDDGQCIKMEERCDQLPQCRDETDERNCKILYLKEGYNKEVPPISSKNGIMIAVDVDISITLLKVVSIEEENHAIQLQFKITMKWKDNRATYHHLRHDFPFHLDLHFYSVSLFRRV